LWRAGHRYRVDAADLPGRPDVVFRRERVAIFIDGDFWHGRDLAARLAKLKGGHNAPYWVAKISANVDRDARRTAALAGEGWLVLRFWETDILRDPGAIVAKIAAAITARRE
jgi:DNA mismatch endonuclease (patch repair protein)